MLARPFQERPLSNSAYVELVRSLFTTLTPTTIMGILFMVVASMAARRSGDLPLAILGAVGGAVSLIRVAITVAFERRANDTELNVAAAVRVERLFGLSYLTFASTFGLFAARALQVSDIEVQMVVAALVVGYAAGVAAGVSLRPWISIPAVLAAVLPTAFSAALGDDLAHAALAFVLVALLAGGISSMLARYRSEAEKIAMRQTFASLARTDHLTGLANRLAFGEAFAREVETHGAKRIAVHCLDLDRFKPVNDRLGHPAGDDLLRQVADRLRSLCRNGNSAGRLGGDEFVLLQTGIGHIGEADMMARRIVRALTEPYYIGDHRIEIGVSVGYAVPDGCGEELSALLACADRALYKIKREGGGAAAHARTDGAAVAVQA